MEAQMAELEAKQVELDRLKYRAKLEARIISYTYIQTYRYTYGMCDMCGAV